MIVPLVGEIELLGILHGELCNHSELILWLLGALTLDETFCVRLPNPAVLLLRPQTPLLQRWTGLKGHSSEIALVVNINTSVSYSEP
jgi:hypothetical protein